MKAFILPIVVAVVLLAGCMASEKPLSPGEALAQASRHVDRIIQHHQSDQRAPAAPAVAATPDSPTQITFWYCSHPLVSPALAESSASLAAFRADHPEVKLDTQFIGEWIYAIQKLTVGLAVDDLPDIALVQRSWAGRLIEAGRVAPLDDLLPPELLADLRPEVIRSHTVNGKFYALPADEFCSVLFYDSAQIADPPPTWNALVEQAKSLKSKKPDQYPVGDIPFLEMLWSAGGSIYDSEKSQLTQPPAADSLRFVLSLRDAGLIGPATFGNSDAGMRAFELGDAAMTVASSSEMSRLNRLNKTWKIAPVPGKSGPVSLRSNDIFVVFPKYARAKRDAIAAVIDFLSGPHVQGKRAADMGSIPPRKSVAEKTSVDPGLDKAFAVSRSTPLDSIWSEAEFELNRSLGLAYLWHPQP